MHISESLRLDLITAGWDDRDQDNGDVMFYRREPTGGAFGEAIVTLRIDRTGRWLERVDGWGTVEGEVDLRDYADDPAGAYAAVRT